MIDLTRRHLRIAALAAAALIPCLHAQNVSSGPEAAPVAFDVASVRPSDPNARGSRIGWDSGVFRAVNMHALEIVSGAYGIRDDLVTGAPNWAGSDGFDITAKIDTADQARFEKMKPRERNTLLKPLLADRFKLVAHTEVKQLPVYELVIVKGGSKLVEEKEHTEPDPDHPAQQGTVYSGWVMVNNAGNHETLHGKGISLKSLIDNLENTLERTIIDKTGLTGSKYEITLTWTSEDRQQTDDNAPPLLTALQDQLGLRLVPSRGPVETLVIDHIEKPSQN